MYKIDQNKIDDLFQKGAKKHDFPFNEDAWASLEKRLDKDNRKVIYYKVIAGTLLAIMIFVFINNMFYEISNKNGQTITISTNAVKNKKDNNLNTSKEINVIEDNQKSIYNIEENKITTKTNDKIISNKFNKSNLEEHSISKNKIVTKVNNSKSSQTNTIIEKNIQNQLIEDNVTFIQQNTIHNNIISTIINPIPIINKPLNYLQNSSLENQTNNGKRLATKQNIEINTKTKKKGKFNIGVLLGSEFTTIGLDNLSKLNWKYGLSLEYRWYKKYSADIGINYIHKKSNASKGEYTPPKGFWTNGIAPIFTTATYDILELPLNFTYYFKGYKKSSFYSNIGLSSYFILKESYNYKYEEINQSDLIKKWGSKGKNSSIFSILELSAGYNLKMFKNVDFKVGPYIQIPFNGIGHGKVNLLSIGINMKINFIK